MKHTEYIIPIGEEAKEFDEIFIGVLRKHKELIRCKDCKYCEYWDDGFYVCNEIIDGTDCDKADAIVPLGHYCGYGERKEE